ncbi:Thiamine-phosphate synthase [Phycisphaerae bacterium RAS1]|nr:Thiamine-phosphate synthase [Phycisphaerae bacterium RAS1]
MNADANRIVDVNFNRTREALRVLEDYARFVLDDRTIAATVKQARHDLAAAVAAAGPEQLLAARDIAGDVGRASKTPTELSRPDAQAVLRSAFGRLTESARSLGEFGKLISADLAAAAEALRYRAYEWEQVMLGRGELRARFRAVRLYVIITEALCKRDWLATAEAAIRGGAACVQLREKSLPDGELLSRARRLRELTAPQGVLFIVNDRPDIARLAHADGVHVGQDDVSVNDARRVLGGDRLIGKSTHSLEQVAAAIAENPDYIAVGPMFASTTKPQEHVPGTALLARAAERTALPRVAIGGITPLNVAAVTAAGASAVCVCAAVISADDPAAAAAAILAAAGRTAPAGLQVK